MRFCVTAALTCWFWSVTATGNAGIIVEFNYSFDSTDFFSSGSDARATLEAAGDFFESILADDLRSIESSGFNTWSAVFTNPTDGTVEVIDNLVVPADTLIVYVGARNLAGSSLGRAGPGAFAASGSLAWVDRVESRGELEDDFGPWGGFLSVDSSAVWHKDSSALPSSTENDLYSVLLHEIAHVLGIGTAPSWQDLVNEAGNTFVGASASAAFGASVPLSNDHGHKGLGRGDDEPSLWRNNGAGSCRRPHSDDRYPQTIYGVGCGRIAGYGMDNCSVA
ncbi:MAG: hypothetical protein O2931_05980 [Planctomycetota bacterium]|nr:hypothetical protein [Planctomycetota bacterium]MDA1178333.1 hypothetical protein [Planctomycetota bacterium]